MLPFWALFCELDSPALWLIIIVIHNPTVGPHPSKKVTTHVHLRKKVHKDRCVYIYIYMYDMRVYILKTCVCVYYF